MFLMGILARQKNLIDKMDARKAKRWFLAAFAVGVPWWVLMVWIGDSIQGGIKNITLHTGGWNWLALSFALWESFFCVTFILGLVGIFKARFNTQNSLQKFLSTNSFGVYVFHAPVLIAVSVLLMNLNLPSIVKFFLVSSIVLPTTFIIVHFIRKIPLFRKIFS
jgi:surface polysaccharide O-acyltransferase-like enzyme